MKQGLGLILKPKSIDSVVTLSNLGQRQAILHDLAMGLGVYRDDDKPSLVPFTQHDLNDGRIAIFFLPQIKDMEEAIDILQRVPVLEKCRRVRTQSDAHLEKGKCP